MRKYLAISLLLSCALSVQAQEVKNTGTFSPTIEIQKIRSICEELRQKYNSDQEKTREIDEHCDIAAFRQDNADEVVKNKKGTEETIVYGLDFSGQEFSDGVFEESDFRLCSFERALLERVRFNAAHLEGVNFNYAQLKEASFERAMFGDIILPEHGVQARSSFEHADLRQAQFGDASLIHVPFNQANVSSANFTFANLSKASFEGADLMGADFTGATLNYARLSTLRDATISDATKNACLEQTIFNGAELSQADFVGMTINGCFFEGVTGSQPFFSGAHVQSTSFDSASINEAVFLNSSLKKVSFKNANLKGANFKGAHLEDVDFDGAVLDGADFTDVKFGRGVDFSQAKSQSGAVFVGMVNVEQIQQATAAVEELVVASVADSVTAATVQTAHGAPHGEEAAIELEVVPMEPVDTAVSDLGTEPASESADTGTHQAELSVEEVDLPIQHAPAYHEEPALKVPEEHFSEFDQAIQMEEKIVPEPLAVESLVQEPAVEAEEVTKKEEPVSVKTEAEPKTEAKSDEAKESCKHQPQELQPAQFERENAESSQFKKKNKFAMNNLSFF